MKKLLFLLLFSTSFANPALLSLGGGYWDAGRNHSSGLAQIEYKWARCFWGYVRPQASLVIPEFKAAFLGVGIGLDLYATDHIVITPNFEPGLYFQGEGRNLGHVIEFRSALEFAYEMHNWSRLGVQFYHISNASLGKRNPGANAITLFFAFPL